MVYSRSEQLRKGLNEYDDVYLGYEIEYSEQILEKILRNL